VVNTPSTERLAIARNLLARLVEAERAFLATSPYRLVHEHDMRGGRYVVRATVVEPVPDEIVRLCGETSFELRGALDAIATELAGVPTAFPLYESLPLFAQRSRKAISRMPDEAQAAIEGLQPYHAIGGFQNGPLWILRQLESRLPIRLAAGGVRREPELGVNTRRKVDLVGEPAVTCGAFDDGAVIASVQTTIVGHDPKLDMYLRAEFELAFDRKGPARGRAVLAMLGELCDHVEHVLGALAAPQRLR
jgi:hypothetical protein